MKDQKLYLYWLYLFILCAALGFIPEPQGLLQALLALTAMLFFVPPVMLLYRGIKQGKRKHLRIIRNLSALSLLVPGGVCTICAYPGHAAGDVERHALADFLAQLRPQEFNVLHHRFLNAGVGAPECFVIQKQ